MKTICYAILCLCILSSCKKEFVTSTRENSSLASNAASITSVEATYWDSVFTRYGNGWTGGDGAMSYHLPDGRVMWLWGDSFLDTVYLDRHRPVVGFIHNQLTTMDING